MPGSTPDQTPGVWVLRQQMFLVPAAALGTVSLDLLRSIPSMPWPATDRSLFTSPTSRSFSLEPAPVARRAPPEPDDGGP
jgi:hypothetical protein